MREELVQHGTLVLVSYMIHVFYCVINIFLCEMLDNPCLLQAVTAQQNCMRSSAAAPLALQLAEDWW